MLSNEPNNVHFSHANQNTREFGFPGVSSAGRCALISMPVQPFVYVVGYYAYSDRHYEPNNV